MTYETSTHITKRAQLRNWIVSHKRVSILIAGATATALIAGATFGAVAIATAVQTENAKSTMLTASEKLRVESVKASNAQLELTKSVAAAKATSSSITALIAASAGILDDKGRTAVDAARAALQKDAEKPGPTSVKSPDFGDPNTIDEYRRTTTTILKTATAYTQQRVAIEKLLAAIDGAQLNVVKQLRAWTPTSPASAKTVLDANAKAAADVRTALDTSAKSAAAAKCKPAKNATACSSAEEAGYLLGVLNDVVTKAKAVQASQVAAVEKEEADARAAAEASNAPTYTAPDGTTKQNPTYRGGGTGGGGTSGGTSGGGTGGGAGGTGGGVNKSFLANIGSHVGSCPADHPVTYSFDDSASYGSYVTVPNLWLNYSKTDTGSGWSVSGQYCDTW